MLDKPEIMAMKSKVEFHDELEVGKNVSVYVPYGITETLKITVLDNLKGVNMLRKCAPYMVLPSSEVHEVDNTNEYKDIMMLLIMSARGKKFALPISGFRAQRQSNKEAKRSISLNPNQKAVLFPKAKMPGAYIKSELERLSVSHLSFLFLVNGKIVRDKSLREAEINTNNVQGISRTKERQIEAYNDQMLKLRSLKENPLPYLNNNLINTPLNNLPNSTTYLVHDNQPLETPPAITYPIQGTDCNFFFEGEYILNKDISPANYPSLYPMTNFPSVPSKTFINIDDPNQEQYSTPIDYPDNFLDPIYSGINNFPVTVTLPASLSNEFNGNSIPPSTPNADDNSSILPTFNMFNSNQDINININNYDNGPLDLPLDSTAAKKRKVEDVNKKFHDVLDEAAPQEKTKDFLLNLTNDQLQQLDELFIEPLAQKKKLIDEWIQG